MKYTKESLDFAIDELLPDIKAAKSLGVTFDTPTLCDMVAKQFFLKSEDDLTFRHNMLYYVVLDAMRDLEALGFFDFGTRNIKDEV